MSKKLEQPGSCTKCGTYSEWGRNTAGQCTACHNTGYREYKDRRRQWLEIQRDKGRQYWAEHGIKPGDKLEKVAVSMFGLGAQEVVGTAKVGVVGAYVSSKFQSGYLAKEGWRKV